MSNEPQPEPQRRATDGSIVLAAVSVFYGEVVGLSDVTLAIGPGITGVVGPNGSGKTTLMRTLSGLVATREGLVRVLGGDPFVSAATRARIGFVPATEIFFDHASGHRNLELAFLARGHRGSDARTLAGRALDAVGLAADGHRPYGTWSRGMRQRLKLGLTLTADVDVVLLDEPFLGVDPPNRQRIRELVAQLGEAGRTVVLSSHVLHEIESLTDQVGILAHGRLLGHGTIAELLASMRERFPQRFVMEAEDARALGAVLLTLGSVRSVEVLDAHRLSLTTTAPDEVCAALPQLVADRDLVVRGLRSESESLEALFAQVTAAGVGRL